MIKYWIEPFSLVLPELKEMVHSHAAETELYNDKMPLDPKYDLYQTLEDNNSLVFITARDNINLLVGYLSIITEDHPHHNIKSATNNLMYVHENYRGQGIAKGMLEAAEEFLRANEISMFQFIVKAANPMTRLSEELGFDCSEIVYSKYIGEDK